MMFFISCNTTTIIEKRIYYVPDVDFPQFPELGDYEKIADNKIATDEGFFRDLLNFKTIYNDSLRKYEEKKKLMKENENE